MSKFLSVQCQKCKAKQVVFGNATLPVKCAACGTIIAEPTGGRASVKGKVMEVLS